MRSIAKWALASALAATPLALHAQDARHAAVDAVEAPITADLNGRVSSNLGTIQDQNAQAEADYAARMQAYENADAAHSQAQTRYAYQRQAYDRAMRDWRAQVAACQDGYRSACDAPPPDPADY
ncbi:hypothetical protein [Flavisphingomonas formosensis]|uniref:hypothetical protein n=1 Tax=Flavisphingomonas formosensis TaxID=861534 RepID=UPI0012FA2BDB|nr:hypothetical protein [Sphingomonas formosensis]